ncbi:hypothetical protein V8C42DRAFT_328158 [Trichoderma barbatum]
MKGLTGAWIVRATRISQALCLGGCMALGWLEAHMCSLFDGGLCCIFGGMYGGLMLFELCMRVV